MKCAAGDSLKSGFSLAQEIRLPEVPEPGVVQFVGNFLPTYGVCFWTKQVVAYLILRRKLFCWFQFDGISRRTR